MIRSAQTASVLDLQFARVAAIVDGGLVGGAKTHTANVGRGGLSASHNGAKISKGHAHNDLGVWLADEFFDGHCRLFQQTPFVWHVWDGARGGFSALVNYHRLCEPDGGGRRLLEKLRDTYLGEWIGAQRRAVGSGEAGAEARLIAAEHLRDQLTQIIDGDPPYDIFVRWKPLHRQPIGWEPDIDDGVRLNIRPFLTAKPKTSGRKDACILRVTLSVKKHAGADRGGELPPQAAWQIGGARRRARPAVQLLLRGRWLPRSVGRYLPRHMRRAGRRRWRGL